MKAHFLLYMLLAALPLGAQSGGAPELYSRADSLRGSLSPLRACFDVLTYDLDIAVDIKKRSVSGSNTITFRAVDDMQRMQIDLFSNMHISRIECGDHSLIFRREFNAVFIDLPSALKRSDITSIRIFYSGNPIVAKNPPWDGGFSWKKDGKNDWVGVSCQGIGASLWWPCKDHQSDEPDSMWIRVTVPEGYMNVSNGRLKAKVKAGKRTTRYDWFVSYPINNYDVTLNIARYKHFSDSYPVAGSADTLSLDYYVLPRNYDKAREQFMQVKPMMECYYKLFGAYPFVRDGYKLVETPYLGMEHQSAVAYGNNYVNGYMGTDLSGSGAEFDYIIIHESAHEWWGNAVTSRDIADMWIHEGFTTYAEALYVECMHGHEKYLAYINGIRQNVRNDRPVIGPYEVNREGSDDMYPKGALLIHTIRSILDDDEKFFTILKGLQDTFRYRTVSTDEVEHYISGAAGRDLSKVFDQYLRRKEIPVLEIRTLQQGADLQVKYRWWNEKEKLNTFDMPVKISFTGNEFEMVFPTGEWQTIILPGMKKENVKIATDLFYIDVLSDKKQ